MARLNLSFKPHVVALLIAIPALHGCTANVLQGIRLSEASTIALGQRHRFLLEGEGTCQSANVDWGDGTIQRGVVPVPGSRIEFETSNVETRALLHTYTGWGGGKTITVEGVGCEGKLTARFNANQPTRSLAWNQPATSGTNGVCQTFAGLPAMIPRMLVKIALTTVTTVRDIDFGCFAGGCVYNADGKAGSVADSTFPFAGMKEYSAVFRIGSQLVQGGTNTQFTTTSSGTLEFCLNDGDNDLTNNRGGFNVTIGVDQLGP